MAGTAHPREPVHALVAERHDRAARRRPAFALAAVVIVGTIAYAAAAQLVPMPLLSPDELRYTLAARALAHGDWPSLRGGDYGYGPVYPAVLAPILALAGGIEAAYPLFKVANALLFSLAAVPIFLLARRLLSPWWSVAVAAMSVAIPSSIYTSLVMTESASYLTASLALLALVLALERPSAFRQLALLAAVALAYATRAQFAALLPAFVAGHLLVWGITPGRRRLRHAAGRLWPTLAALGLTVAAFLARPLLTWSSPRESLGGYADLWRGYDLASVARFVVYHLAGWEIYLFVVPFVVAPIVVGELVRGARRGAASEAAFVAAFVTVNAVLVGIAAAFASTPYGYSELHDRYLFYVAPLWLVALCVWLSRGLPRPPVPTAIGVAISLVLPAIVPFGLIGGDIVVEAVPIALWSWVWTLVENVPQLDGRRVLGLSVVALVAISVAVPRRLWLVVPTVVVGGLLLVAGLAWERQADVPEEFTLADRGPRSWVDDALPDGSRATKVYVSPLDCPYDELTRQALFLTELFNASLDGAAAIGDATPDGLPLERADVRSGGRLVLADGRPLVAAYVLTQPKLRLAGRVVARGTGAGLVLWQTRGAVRLADPGLRDDDLAPAGCG